MAACQGNAAPAPRTPPWLPRLDLDGQVAAEGAGEGICATLQNVLLPISSTLAVARATSLAWEGKMRRRCKSASPKVRAMR